MKKIVTFKLLSLLISILLFSSSCDKTKFLPILTTTTVSNITQNTVNSGGEITSDGGSDVTARGVCWSLKPNPTIKDSLTKDAAGTGVFISSIKNLLADTTYYVRAYATNKDGTAYGIQVTFKTLKAILPTISTTSATNVTESTAVSGGNIISDGGSRVTARGVCWSKTIYPTIIDSKTSDGLGIGTFSSNLTNLQSATYYIRAYASNSAGTSYGNQISFKTLSTPTIETITPSNLPSNTGSTATCGGNVTYDGGLNVLSRGVCWNTTGQPTISNNKTVDGSGIGQYTSNLTNLSYGTNYYIRAYATNNIGTSYGSELIFTTVLSPTDIDGNVYHTVKIGTQIWLVENLKVTHYRNGDPIPNITSNTAWIALTTGAYCQYNNSSSNATIYGNLYNWYCVNDVRNIAPVGWHVATQADWKKLSAYGSGALKESGFTHWNSPNTSATNSTGFTALPGGFRDYISGSFLWLNKIANWWLTEMSAPDYVGEWAINYNSTDIGVGSTGHAQGESVRCVKD